MIPNSSPTPTNIEKHVYGSKSIMCKTDSDGIIEYANEYFVELTEYKEGEIMGESIELIRHPEMPRCISNKIWEQVISKKKVHGILRFLSKSGSFFWLQVKFDFKVNEQTREISNVYFYAKPPSRMAILDLNKFYNKLVKMENEVSLEVANTYFNGFLENKNIDYDNFISKYLENV